MTPELYISILEQRLSELSLRKENVSDRLQWARNNPEELASYVKEYNAKRKEEILKLLPIVRKARMARLESIECYKKLNALDPSHQYEIPDTKYDDKEIAELEAELKEIEKFE